MTATRTLTWNRFPVAGTDVAPEIGFTGMGFQTFLLYEMAEGETLVHTRVGGWQLFGAIITGSGATFGTEMWTLQVPCIGVIATSGPGGPPTPVDPFLAGSDQQDWVLLDSPGLTGVTYGTGDGTPRQEFTWSLGGQGVVSKAQRRREFGGDPMEIWAVYADGGQGLGIWYDDSTDTDYQGYRTIAYEVSLLIEGAAA